MVDARISGIPWLGLLSSTLRWLFRWSSLSALSWRTTPPESRTWPTLFLIGPTSHFHRAFHSPPHYLYYRSPHHMHATFLHVPLLHAYSHPLPPYTSSTCIFHLHPFMLRAVPMHTHPPHASWHALQLPQAAGAHRRGAFPLRMPAA